MIFTLTEILAIILIHYISDFVLQTNNQAIGKGKNWSDLLGHTVTYTSVWFGVGFLYLLLNFNISKLEFVHVGTSVILFSLITFIAHTVTDYFTSRLNTKLLPKRESHPLYPEYFREEKGKNFHNFFVGVGGDQVLHYAQLFITYYYLKP